MTIWDTGTYETEKWNPREVIVRLRGRRAEGRYVFIRTGDNWILRGSHPSPHSDPPPPQPPPPPAPPRPPPDGAHPGPAPPRRQLVAAGPLRRPTGDRPRGRR